MRKKAMVLGLSLILCTLFTTSSAFAGWYTCIVTKVISSSSGTVRMQLLPGTGEKKITDRVQVSFNTAKPGGKNMLATALTAVSMDAEIQINCATVPKWSPVIQIIDIGLVVP